MGVTQLPGVEELIVTGPSRERLYDLFTRLYAGRYDVRVVKDRRLAERRSRPAGHAAERRRADRRRRSPAWTVPSLRASPRVTPPEATSGELPPSAHLAMARASR